VEVCLVGARAPAAPTAGVPRPWPNRSHFRTTS